MAIKRISPKDAADLQAQGYTYVDVRSVPEFEAGRPTGAVNIPFLHRNGMQMAPNPEFLTVLQAAFPPDAKFVLACQAGHRSMNAAELLSTQGYGELVEQMGGFKGWVEGGLPVETGPAPGRDWESMRTKKG